MKRLNGTEMKALFILSMIFPVSFLATLKPADGFSSAAVVGVDASVDSIGTPLPLSVYIVSLSDVGSYRASNHSRVVEGALEAAKVKAFGVFLDWNTVLKVNISTTAHLISDWEAYRMLVEWGNRTIAVNTHDEYLPVPSGYTKEDWVDRIADFMLNRWGTWTHVGGYPFYRVWYQNGTKEEWGEEGWKRLMSHIGRPNATCYPPTDWNSEQVHIARFLGEYLINWYLYGLPVESFQGANPGYPFNFEDFRGQTLYSLYVLIAPYITGGSIYFAPNQTTFNYGVYVHQSAWRFFDANDNEFTQLGEVVMGFVSTAAAIWADVGDATYEVYGTFSHSTPRYKISAAKRQDKTMGLNQAEELLSKAIDSYNAHNYKEAVAYAKQAGLVADKATRQNLAPQVIVGLTLAAVTIGAGAYYKVHNKSRKKES